MQTELAVSQRSVRDRLLLLRRLPGLSGLDDAGYEMLAAHVLERFVPAGERLLREHEPIRNAYLVVDGMVHVSRQGFVTAEVDNGGVGFLSILARDEAGVDAVAIRDSHVFEIPVELIFHAYEENFSFMRNAIRLLATGMMERRDALPRREDEHQDVALGEWFDRPKTLVEKLIIARQSGVLALVNLDAVIDWARYSREVRYEAGDQLWAIGDPGITSFFIQYGRVRCTAPDGRSTCVGADFVLGALDPMAGGVRVYSAVAETKLIGFQQHRDDWMQIVEVHNELGIELMAVLAQQLLHIQLQDAKKKAD